MAYSANPFLERMSERTTSDMEFVRLFSPKILERLAEDAFEGAVHVFRSAPGAGKTTLLTILGGCRLVVTPLGSKLITLGAGLACFEMRPVGLNAKYGVAIPHAEPRRYIASVAALRQSKPEVSVLLLTGEAYGVPEEEEPSNTTGALGALAAAP